MLLHPEDVPVLDCHVPVYDDNDGGVNRDPKRRRARFRIDHVPGWGVPHLHDVRTDGPNRQRDGQGGVEVRRDDEQRCGPSFPAGSPPGNAPEDQGLLRVPVEDEQRHGQEAVPGFALSLPKDGNSPLRLRRCRFERTLLSGSGGSRPHHHDSFVSRNGLLLAQRHHSARGRADNKPKLLVLLNAWDRSCVQGRQARPCPGQDAGGQLLRGDGVPQPGLQAN